MRELPALAAQGSRSRVKLAVADRGYFDQVTKAGSASISEQHVDPGIAAASRGAVRGWPIRCHCRSSSAATWHTRCCPIGGVLRLEAFPRSTKGASAFALFFAGGCPGCWAAATSSDGRIAVAALSGPAAARNIARTKSVPG